jgi:hypothetical protein
MPRTRNRLMISSATMTAHQFHAIDTAVGDTATSGSRAVAIATSLGGRVN